VQCLDEVCFSVTPFSGNEITICLDKECFLAEALDFEYAWADKLTVIWVNNSGYHPLSTIDYLDDANVSVSLNETYFCQQDDCYYPLEFVNFTTEVNISV